MSDGGMELESDSIKEVVRDLANRPPESDIGRTPASKINERTLKRMQVWVGFRG